MNNRKKNKKPARNKQNVKVEKMAPHIQHVKGTKE